MLGVIGFFGACCSLALCCSVKLLRAPNMMIARIARSLQARTSEVSVTGPRSAVHDVFTQAGSYLV